MISKFKIERQEELTEFVLGIQNGEAGLGFERNEQLDLINTYEFYKGGGFWIAEISNEIVGSIGLQKLNHEIGILRKMFVKKELRGTNMKIAQKLFDILIKKAINIGLRRILLDTPAIAKASHRFYEKNGFKELNRENIPIGYKFPDRDSRLYELILKG